MGILIIAALILAISLAIYAAFVALATIVVKKVWFSHYERRRKPKIHKPKNDGRIYSPTGWVWNEYTKLWEPPDDIE